MDESQFDSFTRSFATSRRNAIKWALGGALGATGFIGKTNRGDAARRGFPGPSNPFQPSTCTIAGTTYQANTIDPESPCHLCDPGLNRNDWSPNAGAFCGDGSQVCCDGDCCPTTHCCGLSETCTPCRCEIDGVLHESGDRQSPNGCLVCDPVQSTSSWSPLADQSTCGGVDGRVCCNGDCCSPTECCNGISCEECGPHCHIGDRDFPAGTPNPNDDCEVCDPARFVDSWSNAADGTVCAGGDGCCTGGLCGSCSCTIEGRTIPDGEHNARNDCEFCFYAADPSDWTNRPNGASCGNDRDCCDGECCDAGHCCTLDGCEPCCRIGSDIVADGVVNRTNTCQVCDSNRNSDDWTTLGNGEACGATGNSECCEGECCPSGQCCRNGECSLCDCEIGGRSIPPDTINENNPCEICKPALNRFDWSAISTGTSCDAQGGTCCGRDCCSSDLCCLLDACGECLCSIENQNIDPGTPNPNVACQECNPHIDPFGWSTSPDQTTCGGDQICCGGACCDPGFCCMGGSCQPCGCLIDGVPVLDGAPNPENECQQCDARLDPGNWSNRTETSNCGDGSQICCNGVCCPTGNCCNLDDICEPCRCEIEGTTVEAQEFAPGNLCLVCDPASSTTTWTFGPDYSVCSDPTATVNRFCCQGVCCAEHECCRSDGACGPCTCIIEGVGEFEEGDRNPANDCEFCNPSDNMTGWSVLADGDICGPNLDQTCCSGQCGCSAGCFIDGVNYEDGTIRPGERCDICDAATNPNDWTPRDIPDCPRPCTIGGVIIRGGTPNPDNPCQICRGGEDWSPSTALICGNGEAIQVCCNGVCCESGACCSESGLCSFDDCQLQGCVIDGVQYEDGTVNPDNACQVCNLFFSSTEWTPQFGACGPTGDQFCCNGICCELGACCNNDEVCDFDICQTCAIDGVLWFPEDLNPANTCEWCISNTNKFGWTTKPDNFFCDEMQLTVCCNGACCNPGEGCIGGSCQPS